MISTIVLATHNRHKVREISAILKKARLKVKILTLDSYPKIKPVIENQPTLEGNAAKKARVIAKKTGCLALADDTGLFVKALKGAPGVYSARFAGRKCSYEDNNRKLLHFLETVPAAKRGAEFRCVAALASPQGKVYFAKGAIQGRIARERQGANGFGYDPVFWIPRLKKTFAELSAAAKNKISHRALAFRQIPAIVKKALMVN